MFRKLIKFIEKYRTIKERTKVYNEYIRKVFIFWKTLHCNKEAFRKSDNLCFLIDLLPTEHSPAHYRKRCVHSLPPYQELAHRMITLTVR